MKSLFDLLPTQEIQKKKSGANSERASLVQEFVETINVERKNTKWKPVTGRAIAIKTSHLSKHDLYYLLSICKSSKSGFSKCFFGSLKIKKL